MPKWRCILEQEEPSIKADPATLTYVDKLKFSSTRLWTNPTSELTQTALHCRLSAGMELKGEFTLPLSWYDWYYLMHGFLLILGICRCCKVIYSVMCIACTFNSRKFVLFCHVKRMRSINHPLASILPILWHEVGRRFQCFRALSSEKKKKKKKTWHL